MNRSHAPSEDTTGESVVGSHALHTTHAAHATRVLVVEDDRDFADSLRFELESGGYEVELTSSVIEAQRRMRVEGELDLVISDVRLAGTSGVQLLFVGEGAGEEGEVGASAAPPPPVLMMSGFLSAKLRELVERMGAAVLEKPFSVATLHASILQALHKAAIAKAG